MFKEFKTFILRGNVMDLAVAVILGTAFNAIVSSLIEDVITPLILNPVMSSLGVAELEKIAWHGVKYGEFIAAVINFIVISFVIFIMVRTMNKLILKRDQVLPDAKRTMDQELLTEIRDLLKKQQP